MARTTPRTIYCFNTGPFIEIGRLPRRFFPGVWKRVEGLVRDSRLVSPREVLKELLARSDEIANWAKAQPGLFRPNDPELVRVAQDVLRDFPSLINPNKPGGGSADPFVIALARIGDAQGQQRLLDPYRCVVVSQERARSGKVNIPAVCAHYALTHSDINGVYDQEGWEFS